MTKPRYKREPQIVERGETRWERNRLVGVPGVNFNATSTPLDAYKHAKIITDAQYDCGNQLRELWEKAGQSPNVTGSFEPRTDDSGEISPEADEAMTTARRRYRVMLDKLTPVYRSLAYHVCCHGRSAELWANGAGQPPHNGILMLRDALEGMRR